MPVFEDSEVRYDDMIGFEEYTVVVGDEEVTTVMGTIRRQFFRPEAGSSPLEIMMFYQGVVEDLGGTILFQTREAQSIRIDGERLRAYFSKERLDRGMSTYVWDFFKFPEAMSEYLSAVVPFGDGEQIARIIGKVENSLAAGDLEHFTMLSLALESGFRSKSTFNRVFKETCGISPSEYLEHGGLQVERVRTP